jgi:hypothetical protein
MMPHNSYDAVHQLMQKGFREAQQSAMPGRSSEDAAQHISPALIGRETTVC